jgi:biopolymer transport protein ExbD
MKTKRRPQPDSPKPQMTSLVDVLTVLVFFLLKNFSTDGDIVTPAAGLTLPQSSSLTRPEKIWVIAISQEHILAEGQPIALVADEQKREGYQIPALLEWLDKRRKNTDAISEYDTTVGFTGKLNIQGDRGINFAILQKVLITCGEKGYSDFSLAVDEKDAK